jgi:hypothetical protein
MPAKAGMLKFRVPELEPRCRAVLDRPVRPGDDGFAYCARIAVLTTLSHPPCRGVMISISSPLASARSAHWLFGTTS